MKKLFLFAIIAMFSFASCGLSSYVTEEQKTELDAKLLRVKPYYKVSSNGIYVQKVVEVENLSKEDIYIRLLEFMTKSYNDAQEVIQVKDKEEGILVAKGCDRFYINEILQGSGRQETAWHIFKAEIKEGRVRLTVSIESNMESYYAGSYVGSTYIAPNKSEYSILSCYPMVNKEKDTDNYRSGYIFYYATKGIVDLMNSAESALTTQSATSIDDNW